MPIDHLGVLVADLESAVERWSTATGYTFSPVGRYATARYQDTSDRDPHPHDARFVISHEGSPRIELLEATGNGSHSSAHLGAHHLAFTGILDLESRREELAAAGFPSDASNSDDDGRLLLFFTDPAMLDGMRLEFVSALPGPILRADGTPAPLDPTTGRPSILMVHHDDD